MNITVKAKVNFDHIGKWVLLFLPLLFLLYFILKALMVPITHDESGSCLYYSSLPVKAILLYDNPWPTNHILNTLAVKLTALLFGLTQFTGRLPNLITGMVFLFFVFKISRLISTSYLISGAVFLIFLANPYMNDFFSLARGYGMAVAFMTASLYYLLLFLKDITYKNIIAIMIFGFLTVSANFSFLIFTASLNVIIFLICLYSFLRKEIRFQFFVKLIIVLFVFDLIIAGFSYYPVTRMNATNQFQFWGNAGFYHETFVSVIYSFLFNIKYFQGQDTYLAGIFFGVVTIIILSGIFLAMKNKHTKNYRIKVFIISCILLLSTTGINLAQNKFLGTPYLTTRTALVYIPLLALMIGSGLSALHDYLSKTGITLSCIFFIVISIHLIRSYNLSYFKEWQFDQNTFQVLDQLKKIKDNRRSGEKITLNTNWLFSPSFNFYKQTTDLSWLDLIPYHKEPQYSRHDEFYYTVSEEYNMVPAEYKKISVFDNDSRALFQFPGYYDRGLFR
jgi:hypothetical protein